MTELRSIDYKDWYINQKRLPDKTSTEYKSFFDFHKDLCLNGAMMDGVYINPFLYWHLNIWHTEVDVIDARGRIYQNYENVLLLEAGVITGKNYTWITECLEAASIKYYTAALFENTDSIYKSDIVGRYYSENLRELEFYWEKPNNHWSK